MEDLMANSGMNFEDRAQFLAFEFCFSVGLLLSVGEGQRASVGVGKCCALNSFASGFKLGKRGRSNRKQ